jgi:starch phosphorylase
MNEGHSSLLVLALLDETGEEGDDARSIPERVERVKRQCVFTTHTPVPAGHDAFPLDMARRVLPERLARLLDDAECCLDGTLNMTFLALFFSHYINGVSLRHGEISRDMFPSYPINGVTNGVHAVTWTSGPIQEIFDRHLPEWRYDNRYLRYAVGISLDEIRSAHVRSKQDLLEGVRIRTGRTLSSSALTLGFARRATPYKRSGLLLSDLDRLKNIARRVGPLQILYGGKAHPRDEAGKELIRQVFRAAEHLGSNVPVIYLEDYDMALGRLLCSGVDLWINTPHKPQEASGTSGMKAAVNGVPSFSVLDGWWLEGHVEGVTGWAIGDTWERESVSQEEASSLYDKLEYIVAPMFYDRPNEYARVMRSAIALNGSFFNAQRMLSQYIRNAYRSGW